MKNLYIVSFLIFHYTCLFLSIHTASAKRKEYFFKDTIEIVKRDSSKSTPYWHNAIYISNTENILKSNYYVSYDNGITWKVQPVKANFQLKFNQYTRRDEINSLFVANKNMIITFVNSFDLKDTTEKTIAPETIKGEYEYYLRYRVSIDQGASYLFEKPIFQNGYNQQNPFPNIEIGKNAFYIGDIGSQPIITKNEKILLPVQSSIIGRDGKPWNPGGMTTYSDAMVLVGTIKKDFTISWLSSKRINVPLSQSTRGLIEPSIIELSSGKLLMVMRGSNGGKTDPIFKIPSYKWYSVSDDGGLNWSQPLPFSFLGEKPFYSPSSMSSLFKHSSGKIFWAGNISKDNCKGNTPRNPLVIAELDQQSFELIPSTLKIIEDDPHADLSHFHLIENRETKQIIFTYPKYFDGYKRVEWYTCYLEVL